MRLFVAVAFDSTAKAKMSELYESMRCAGVTGNFTPTDNLHLTLNFLGEVQSARIEAVKAALDNATFTVCTFGLTSGRCGFFASRGEKTVWLGLDGDGLAQLAKAIDIELSHLGFQQERRVFTPHVTLARRAVCNISILACISVPDIAVTVSSVTLFESRRDNGRLWYKPVYSAKLGSR